MVPSSLAHLYSGARNMPYSMSGTDLSHQARAAISQIPWELHPRKMLSQLAPSLASVSTTGRSLYDVTGAIRMDTIGMGQAGSHPKGIRHTHGSNMVEWTEGAGVSPGNATLRVVDVNNNSGASELLGAMMEGRQHALTLGDVEQAMVLDEISNLFLEALAAIKPGTRAFPGFKVTPEDVGLHRLVV